jgi:O-antigen/teichoic acid export membrane protein
MTRMPQDHIADQQTAPSLDSGVKEALDGIPESSEFKRRSIRGGAATVLGQGFGMVLQVGTLMILAHILSPTDYGLQSMVITLTAFISLVKDAGLNAAAVQHEGLTQELLSTLFWINVALGLLLTALTAAAAPFLAAFYREPRLLWLTVASASTFFFNSLSVQHTTLLNRAMRFGTYAKISLIAAVIGSAIAIVMAALGCGYWSLICQNISLPLVTTIAVWIVMPWWPGRPRWTGQLHSLLRFGGTVTLNNIVIYVAYNTEKILLGRYWGAAALGIYGRAYQLANLPVQQVTDSCGSVAFPMLSRLQSDPERLRRSYLKTHSLVASLTVPSVIICALFTNEIVEIMLGPKWTASIPVLRLLTPAILVFALMNPLAWLLQATGRVARGLYIALFIAPVLILCVVAGLRHGPAGVALGYSVAMVLLFVPLVAWSKHSTGVTMRDYVDCIRRPLTAALTAGLAGWLVKVFLANSWKPLPLFVLELTVFCAAYAGLLLYVMRQKDFYLDLVRNMLQSRRGSIVEA